MAASVAKRRHLHASLCSKRRKKRNRRVLTAKNGSESMYCAWRQRLHLDGSGESGEVKKKWRRRAPAAAAARSAAI